MLLSPTGGVGRKGDYREVGGGTRGGVGGDPPSNSIVPWVPTPYIERAPFQIIAEPITF